MAINNGMDFAPRPEARSGAQIVLKGFQEAASLRAVKEPAFSFKQPKDGFILEASSQFAGGDIFGFTEASAHHRGSLLIASYMFYNTGELGPVILHVTSIRSGEYRFRVNTTQDISKAEIVAFVRDEKDLPREKIDKTEWMEVSQGERIPFINPSDGKNEFFPYPAGGGVPADLLQAVEDLHKPSRALITKRIGNL